MSKPFLACAVNRLHTLDDNRLSSDPLLNCVALGRLCECPRNNHVITYHINTDEMGSELRMSTAEKDT